MVKAVPTSAALALSFDYRHRVLLAAFGDVLSAAAIAEHDAKVGRFTARHGGPVRGIADFSRIKQVDMALEVLSARAQEPPMIARGQRVYVAASYQMFGLCRMFGTYQGLAGHAEPQIVETLVEACALLGMDRAEFTPVV